MTLGKPSGVLGTHGERSGEEPLPETSLPGLLLMTNSFETGGSERQCALLARSLNSAAFRVHMGCIQRRGAFLDGLDYVPEFPLGGSLYSAKSLWTRFRLAHYLRRNNIAVAHAFDFYTNLTLIAAARLAGVPVVIGSQRQLGDLLSRTKSQAQAAMFRWCDAVVCNSHAAADQVVEHGVRQSRVVVIGNGLPASAFADVRPLLPRQPEVLRVGMIARMNTQSKNHKVFLRAAARLRGRFPDLEFLLVGDGPLRPELEREVESLGLKDCVLFLGDRQDISEVLASLDISVLTSSSESLSNVILESMAAGVPVVASRVGGNPELITPDRGMLVAREDDKAFADAIERLLLDAALRASLSRNAKRFAQATSGWSTCASATRSFTLICWRRKIGNRILIGHSVDHREGEAVFKLRLSPRRRATLVDNRCRRSRSCVIGRTTPRSRPDLFSVILLCHDPLRGWSASRFYVP